MNPQAARLCAITLMALLCLWVAGCSSKAPQARPETPRMVVLKPIFPPKPFNADIPIYNLGEQAGNPAIEIGRLTVTALDLEAGIDAIKDQARRLGADAIVDLAYQRRFHHEHARNFYVIDGVAVVWKER